MSYSMEIFSLVHFPHHNWHSTSSRSARKHVDIVMTPCHRKLQGWSGLELQSPSNIKACMWSFHVFRFIYCKCYNRFVKKHNAKLCTKFYNRTKADHQLFFQDFFSTRQLLCKQVSGNATKQRAATGGCVTTRTGRSIVRRSPSFSRRTSRWACARISSTRSPQWRATDCGRSSGTTSLSRGWKECM